MLPLVVHWAYQKSIDSPLVPLMHGRHLNLLLPRAGPFYTPTLLCMSICTDILRRRAYRYHLGTPLLFAIDSSCGPSSPRFRNYLENATPLHFAMNSSTDPFVAACTGIVSEAPPVFAITSCPGSSCPLVDRNQRKSTCLHELVI